MTRRFKGGASLTRRFEGAYGPTRYRIQQSKIKVVCDRCFVFCVYEHAVVGICVFGTCIVRVVCDVSGAVLVCVVCAYTVSVSGDVVCWVTACELVFLL